MKLPTLISITFDPPRIMQMSFTKTFNAFLSDEQGAELAEYAVACALLVAIGLIVNKTLGNAVNDQNRGTGAKVLETTNFTP